MMFRKSVLKTAQLQSYLCLRSPSQLLSKDLQTIILIAVDGGLSAIYHIHFTLLSHHGLAGKRKCQKALELRKGIAKTPINEKNRKQESNLQVRQVHNKLSGEQQALSASTSRRHESQINAHVSRMNS